MTPISHRPILLADVASCPNCRRIVVLLTVPARVAFRGPTGVTYFTLPTTRHWETALVDPGWLSRKVIRLFLGKAVVAHQGFAHYGDDGRPHVCKGGES